MITPVYSSKKLEKHIDKLLFPNHFHETVIGPLGGWNANLFFVERKKCWLLTNARTKYSVIFTDIKASDLEKMNELFLA